MFKKKREQLATTKRYYLPGQGKQWGQNGGRFSGSPFDTAGSQIRRIGPVRYK
jgi:hypothetical protein